MKILFPTDFSSNSEAALKYAIDFMHLVNGHLTILHAYNVPIMEPIGIGSMVNYSSGPSAQLQEHVEKDKKEEVDKQLTALARKHGLVQGEDCECIALKGDVKKDIDLLLGLDDYDLIVLGTRGENSLKGTFFGGMARHLVTHGTCPVLAIPPDGKYKTIKQIIYPTDLKHEESGSLNWLVNYARLHDATIKLMHVTDEEIVKEKLYKVEDLIESLHYDKVNYIVVKNNDVAQAIVDMGEMEDVDMISMTTHTTTLLDRIFHSSLTAQVMEKVNVPFLGFSDKDVLPYNFNGL